MITKISMANSMIQRNFNSSTVSFKGYQNTCEDIKIRSEKVNSPVSNMSGDIVIQDSTINGKVSDMSGDIFITSSKVNGDIKNISGDIIIGNTTNITGNIENISGATVLRDSSLSGNISSTSGNIIIMDSTVEGSVKSMAKNIQLKGNNEISELVIIGAKKGPEKSEAEIKAELAKQGIFINGKIGQINNTAGSIIVNNFNYSTGACKTTIVEPSLEFILPEGNEIKTIRFDADKQGVVLLKEGRKFCGKIINGTIKRI